MTVTEDLCRNLSEVMVDRLVELHAIDYRETGLAEISKPDGFMERQVHGWIGRYERAKTDEIDGLEQLKQWLADHIPKDTKRLLFIMTISLITPCLMRI